MYDKEMMRIFLHKNFVFFLVEFQTIAKVDIEKKNYVNSVIKKKENNEVNKQIFDCVWSNMGKKEIETN